MSWHSKLDKPEDLYLLNRTGNAKVDNVIDFIKKDIYQLINTFKWKN